ncbi:hypothetical protein [Streptomyces phaeochromogenes]|uniref:hypothetical protein n=1 Tax=Streptomyces phaeochromogenes TaxID=1923 RepID=UPI002DDB0C7C|nr:hypothetical protein [Streptomyces phaeochromogenes]WRZ30167.1 hypothetical protein OG931_21675 [Streptomyces phaeochromogenes]
MASGVLVGRGYVSIRPEFEGDWSRSVNARASGAGRSGASAFSKSFGIGLKGIGALAGVAVAANLNAAAAGAAVLAPALTTAGAAAGALKLGLSGVGGAFKAAFADTSAQASSAASATRAVESAQRGLANAQRALADAREQAAERMQDALRAVGDAERNLTRTVQDAAEKQRDAKERVQDAVRELAESQREAREVQASLTEARREAARELEDLNSKLANSRLEEREAAIAMAEAEKELRAAQAKPGNRPEDIAKLQLAYDQAAQAVADQALETKQLSEDAAKANKAGVDGSKKVLDAQQRIADAQQEVADKERALGKAREQQHRASADAAREVADAQRALAEAEAGVGQAREDGARQIADAQRGVADAAAAVADAQAAAAGQASAFDKAMSKLAPNAQSFVRAVQGLAPAWRDMKLGVQQALFEGLDSTVTDLGRTTIPILKRQLTETAGVWNQIAKSAAAGITEMAKTGMLDKILKGATDNLAVFRDTPKQIITALGQLSVAAQPAFNSLLTQMAGGIKSFTDGIAKSFASGGLEEATTTAFGILSQFGTLLGNVLGTVSQIFKAAADAGGSIVGSLSAVFGELRKVLATDEMQAALKSLFGSIAQIVGALAPVIGAIVQAVVPLMAAIAKPIAELAHVLGPVLEQLATTLGAALMPIIEALAPVLVQVGTAIIQIVKAVMPLLQPIAELIAAVISSLAPALTPVIALISQLVLALVGPLTDVIKALAPILVQVGEIIAEVFDEAIAAVEPLIPIVIELVESVFAALLPVLPPLADAFGAIAKAALTLLPPIVGIAAELAKSLAPVIADLAPVVAELAGTFAGVLAAALPPLTEAVLILFEALDPLWPLIGELVGQVVSLATGLLVQLMPSFVQLAVALLPILPALAEIVALVLTLAVNVLSVLLPPLISLAGYLTGQLATSLQTVIGWISGMVTWLTKKLGPAFRWLLDKGVGPVWDGIRNKISGAWGAIRQNVLIPIRTFFTQTIPSWGTTLKNRVTGAWGSLRDGVSGVWGSIKNRVLYPLRDFFTKTVPSWGTTLKNRMIGAFQAAKDGIKTQWDKLKGIAKGPINFIVDIVYNKGIRGVWNKIASAFGAPKLDKFQFAQGGVFGQKSILPGYTPGRDPHRFYSDSGMQLDMSGGESIFRPEFTRGVGSGFVSYFNRLAKSSGASGVRKALAPVLGGNPRTSVDRSLKYAGGGIHQAYADGGIFGWIGKGASAVAGAGSAAWNGIKKGASWLKDTLESSARAGVRKVVDPLLKRFPGADTGIGKMMRKIPDRILDALFGYSKKADKKGAGGIGGPRVQAGLKWVKTQAGLPYQWAGNGDPSWDCSGLVSAVESVIRGQKPHRRWATGSFSGKTAPPGWVLNGKSAYRIGITNKGVGHTAGTIGKTNIESRGGDGVVVGKRARGYDDKLFTHWYGFAPGKYDQGGWLQPGWNFNGMRTPEAVLTPQQLRTLEGAAAVGVAAGSGQSVTYEINARTADFTVADLQRVQRVQEAKARVGRPR